MMFKFYNDIFVYLDVEDSFDFGVNHWCLFLFWMYTNKV